MCADRARALSPDLTTRYQEVVTVPLGSEAQPCLELSSSPSSRSSPPAACSRCRAAQRVARHRRQPGLRRRRQRRRAVRQRLRRAVQPRLDLGRRRRLDDPVRLGDGQKLAGHRADRLDRAGAPLPRAAGVGRRGRRRRCRPRTRRARRTSPSRAARSRSSATRRRSPVAQSAGQLLAVASVADLVGYGSADRLRGLRCRAGDRQHDRRRCAAATGAPTPTPNAADFAADARRRHATPRAPRRRRAASSRHRRAACRRAQPWTSTSSPRSRSRSSDAAVSFGNRDDGRHARARLRAGDRGQQQRRRVRGHRPADGVPAGRSAARHRGNAPSGGQIGGCARRRSDGRRSRSRRPRTCSSGRRPRRAPRRGDVWDTRLGFISPLPVVPAGRYTATVTFTVIGR